MTKRTAARKAADGFVAAESTDETLPALSERLGHVFADPGLLAAALTHPSAPRRNAAKRGDDFERLEFLGDRVLSLVMADWLFARFPTESEGDLSRRHAELVRRDLLARIALGIGLDRALRLARSEADDGGANKANILADAFEAVLGAMFRDGGLGPARDLIVREFSTAVDAVGMPPRDAKTQLQEWAQGRALALPAYTVVSRDGPAHQPHFVVAVAVAGHAPARGEGASKQAAEQNAAGALLDLLPGART